MALHWVGPDGTILWANKAELKMLGYADDEYIGHNLREFHMDQEVIENLLSLLAAHQDVREYESRLRCKDGSILYAAITSNVHREATEFMHTRCFTRDITAEKLKNELRERLAAIVDGSDDAIIGKDLNGMITSWNRGAERIYGYTPEEVIGKHVSILADPGRVDEIPEILARIARGERVDHFETRRRTKDGKVLTVSLTVSPILDASGTIIGASKVARDITDNARMQAELQEANEALSRAKADLEQFVYSASHDLLEPLRMVSAYSEMLRHKFESQLGDKADLYISYMVQGVNRMDQILRDLSAYTHASSIDADPIEDLDANEILARVLLNLEPTIQANAACITHTDLPKVRLHPYHLEQLFQNLIVNAIRYRRNEPPRIHVTAERAGAEWIFSVKDNGIGIDPQYKEQIFGIFKRLHSAAEYPGSGMGLAICQRIVQRSGGRIWVESEIDQGSTFFFSSPAATDEPG
jgi:PAS domain S-box-containing protein